MTDIRTKLSKKNPDYISKHRYLELRHFCLQYNEWKESLSQMDIFPSGSIVKINSNVSDPTARIVMKRSIYLNNIKMIEECSKETDVILAPYILKAVTDGLTYDKLNARSKVPCSRDVFYKLYRRFFKILNEARMEGEEND